MIQKRISIMRGLAAIALAIAPAFATSQTAEEPKIIQGQDGKFYRMYEEEVLVGGKHSPGAIEWLQETYGATEEEIKETLRMMEIANSKALPYCLIEYVKPGYEKTDRAWYNPILWLDTINPFRLFASNLGTYRIYAPGESPEKIEVKFDQRSQVIQAFTALMNLGQCQPPPNHQLPLCGVSSEEGKGFYLTMDNMRFSDFFKVYNKDSRTIVVNKAAEGAIINFIDVLESMYVCKKHPRILLKEALGRDAALYKQARKEMLEKDPTFSVRQHPTWPNPDRVAREKDKMKVEKRIRLEPISPEEAAKYLNKK